MTRSLFAGMSNAEAVRDQNDWSVRVSLRAVDSEISRAVDVDCAGRWQYVRLCLRVAAGCVLMALRAPGRFS